MRKRVTDTARLDWLADNKAGIAYRPSEVGPGWIHEERWYVKIGSDAVGYADTLRSAIDAAMTRGVDSPQTERS